MACQAARLGRAAVRGEPRGSLSGDAGGPPHPAPESRRSPQVSEAPPVPPGPSGEPAQEKGREVAQGPRGRKTEGAGGEPGAPRGPVPPGETAPCVGGPSGGEQGGRQRTPPPPQRRLHDGAEGRGPRPTLGPGSCSEGGTRRFSYARKEAQMVVILGKIQF